MVIANVRPVVGVDLVQLCVVGARRRTEAVPRINRTADTILFLRSSTKVSLAVGHEGTRNRLLRAQFMILLRYELCCAVQMSS